jgi:16S rRNA processing protein RimM
MTAPDHPRPRLILESLTPNVCPPMTNAAWIEIGRIVAPQGLRGELRVYPSSDFPERFLEPGPRWLQSPSGGEPQPVELVRGRELVGKNLYVIQLASVTDRTQAEALRGWELLVAAGDRPDLDEGEFYVPDLIGLPVVLQASGELLGEVTDLIDGPNELLEVRCRDGHLRLIPFVAAIVPVVDLEARRIEVTPPPGLLDL